MLEESAEGFPLINPASTPLGVSVNPAGRLASAVSAKFLTEYVYVMGSIPLPPPLTINGLYVGLTDSVTFSCDGALEFNVTDNTGYLMDKLKVLVLI